ncbi:MAG: hypothetical protein D6798_20075 [Deltaproteobacteria bacterium]|nr:MAG: hypothetical protein D6798_20075 [Deltaproteobacteria bacterium]
MRALILPLLCSLAACRSVADGQGQPLVDVGDTGAWHLDLDPDCSPFAMADDCLTPWPNMERMAADPSSETGLRLSYDTSMFWSPDGELPLDPSIVNLFDGVSPTQPAIVNLGRDVAPDLLSGLGDDAQSLADDAAIALVRVATGERVPLLTEMDRSNRELGYDGRYALIIRPTTPLEPGERYVVALTDDLVDVDGQPFDSPDAFTALRDDIATDDARVEDLRDRYDNTLFPALEQAGLPREHLLLAWEYQVASEAQILGPITSMRDQALADIEEGGVPFTVDLVEQAPNDRVAFLVEGEFQPPSFLVDNELAYADDAYSAVLQSDRQSFEYTMIVPAGLAPGEPVPLVVMGHGLFGQGRDYLTSGGVGEVVQEMAVQAGAVVIATDWIGLSGGDLDLILEEVVPDIARIRIVTDRLAQSLVNNIALVELARRDLQFVEGLPYSPDAPLIDPDRLYYYGVSLGGIQGTSFTALHPDVQRAVVAVPGAGWTHMIQRSVDFTEIDTLLDLLYPDPLTQLVFVSALQSFFDASDPVNLGRLLRDSDKTVIVQEAIGDCQVPNLATEILARTVGVSHLQEAIVPIYGVDTVQGPIEHARVLTQIELPDALDDYMPPDENTIPTQDNGVHSNSVLSDVALSQVLTLVETGQAVHPCDGACDPD